MSEEEDFASMLDASMATGAQPGSKKLRPGQRVQGIVVQISADTVFVDVGARSEGRIARHELSDHEGQLKVAEGERISATVRSAGDSPELTVAMGRGGSVDASDLELAKESGAPVEGEVQKAVKAGLEVRIGKVRAFCPVSQIELSYVEDPSIYEGQRMQFRVLEVKDGGRSVIVSRRALLEAEREEQAQQTLVNLREGQTLSGRVEAVKDYGAFVDIGGIRGLLHISELGAGRVESVTDVVSVGETVDVRVVSIEQGDENTPPRVRLSMRAQTQRKSNANERIITAQVKKVEPFGLLVDSEEGPGVVPHRELDLPPGGDARRRYPPGREVEAVVLGTDDKGRMRLSIKRVEDARARSEYKEFQKKSSAPRKKGDSLGSFGALLAAKLKGPS